MLNFKSLAEGLFLEVSKNDPIPELNRKQNNLGIFLIGHPAAGKSTFFSNFIKPKQKNVKHFSSDDLSVLRRKAAGEEEQLTKYKPGTSVVMRKYLRNFLSSGNNFVMDTTGENKENVKIVFEEAKKHEYDIIFIHLLTPAPKAVQRIKQRQKQGDQDYDDSDIPSDSDEFAGFDVETLKKKDQPDPRPPTEMPYAKDLYTKEKTHLNNFDSTKIFSTKQSRDLMRRYGSWNHDSYYLTVDVGDGEFWFFKYENGELLMRKGSKYVPIN